MGKMAAMTASRREAVMGVAETASTLCALNKHDSKPLRSALGLDCR
jgi:hypothetical protein